MKKTIVTVLVLAALVLAVFAGCSSYSTISPEKANKIALKDAGLTQKDVDDVHAHAVTHDGAACYSIHITVGDKEYEYVIHAKTGEILTKVLPD